MYWLLLIPACLILLLLVALRWAYIKAYGRHRGPENIYARPAKIDPAIASRVHRLMHELDEVPFEPVEIVSHDGLRLFARYHHVADGAPIHIQCHGYRGSSLRAFCGANPLARQKGHNTLMIDQRAHGKSEGKTISFGINERMDVLCWAEYLYRRFGSQTPIFLSGVSMGATTVLMATELPLPKNVVGVIADCPYSSPRAIIRKFIGGIGLPVSIGYPLARTAARLMGGIRGLNTESAVEAVKKSSLPILLIHGENDNFVPCDMSREIAATRPESIRLETFAGADHILSYITDSERYVRISNEFIDDCLKNWNSSQSGEKRNKHEKKATCN